jgi:hypothetical protein
VISESQLNVYIVGQELSPRVKERLQAQVQTALKALPPWVFEVLRRQLDGLGQRNFPVIVEARPDGSRQAINFGQIDGRPAVRLLPRLHADSIDWGQPLAHLLAKAAAWLARPDDVTFRESWSAAVSADSLHDAAGSTDSMWADAGDTDLLLEMFAALCAREDDRAWGHYPNVRRFLDNWRGAAVD